MNVVNFFWHTIDSPIGPLTMVVSNNAILYQINFGEKAFDEKKFPEIKQNKYACGAVALQLDEYFAGKRREFHLEFHVEGTNFTKDVWYRIGKVEFAETMSYTALAKKVGNRNAVRAVSNAVATNPLPIVIPCHRIIRLDGSLGHYARRSVPEEQGKMMKSRLLKLEEGFKHPVHSSTLSDLPVELGGDFK